MHCKLSMSESCVVDSLLAKDLPGWVKDVLHARVLSGTRAVNWMPRANVTRPVTYRV